MKVLVACLMTCFLIGCAAVGGQSKYLSSERSAQTLSEISGMTQAIGQLGDYYASLADDYEGLNETDRDLFRTVVLKAFAPDTLQEDFIEYIRTHVGEEDVSKYLPWLKSDVGRYLVSLELASMSDEADEKMEQLGDSLQNDPVRNELMRVLNEASQVSEFSKDLMPLIFQAMVKGMNALSQPDRRMNKSEMAAMVNLMYQSVLKDLDNELLNESLFTYREANDKQVLDYIAYLEGDIGKRYTADMIGAMTHIFVKASERWRDQLISVYGLSDQEIFKMAECIRRRPGAMCIIEQLNYELEGEIVTKNSEVSGYKNRYTLIAPTSSWSHLESPSDNELVITSNDERAGIIINYKEPSDLKNNNYEEIAQSQIKRFSDKLSTPASKIDTRVGPFKDAGAIYELCFRTTLGDVVCAYGGAAKLPKGQLTFVAFSEGEKKLISELFSWILSIDIAK